MTSNKVLIGVLGLSVPFLFGLATGCEDRFANCTKGFDCPGDGDGPKSGGSSPGGEGSGGNATIGGSESGGAGGNEAGGTSNVGGAPSGGQGGEPSGGAPPQPCGGECPEETPICDEGEGGTDDDECVGCLKHTDCDDPTRPMCSLDKECVPCLDDFTCTNTLVLPEKPVCLDGTADDETGEQRDETGECVECGTSKDCGGDICDQEAHACLDGLKYRTKGVCAPCENDLECIEGQLCVKQVFNDPVTLEDVTIGQFCTWTKAAVVGAANDCANIEPDENQDRPFVRELSATSVGGEADTFCVLATTTCTGYSDHRQTIPGCDQATAMGDQAAADAACGFDGANDGLCRPVTPTSSVYKCSYRCGGTEDCKPSFTCPASGDQFCSIN